MSNSKKECVVVSGMHRSGTSALTRLFDISGASLPKTLMKELSGNPNGHWESQPIVDLHDDFLFKNESSWDDWRAIKDGSSNKFKSFYATNFRKILSQEYGYSKFIVIKDPRICRFQKITSQILVEEGYSPKFAIITRNPIEVARSLEKRNNIPLKAGILIWLRHVLDSEFYSRNYPRGFITFDQLTSNPNQVIQSLWTDMEINHNRITKGITKKLNDSVLPSLRNHYSTNDEILADDELEWWVSKTYEILVAVRNSKITESDKGTLDKIRAELNSIPKLVNSALLSYSTHKNSEFSENIQLKERLSKLQESMRANLAEIEIDRKSLISKVSSFEVENKRNIRTIETLQMARENILRKTNINVTKLEDEIQKNQDEHLETIQKHKIELDDLNKSNMKRVEILEESMSKYRGLNTDINAQLFDLNLQLSALTDEFNNQSDYLDITKVKYDLAVRELRKDLRISRMKATKRLKKVSILEGNLYNLNLEYKSMIVVNNEQSENLKRNKTQIKSLDWRVENLHAQLVAQMASNESRRIQIEAFQNSRFWKLTAFPRKIVNLWRKRNYFLLGLIVGKEIRTIISNKNDIVKSSNHSHSYAVTNAREQLAKDRGTIHNSKLLKYKVGIKKGLSKKNLPNITISAVTYNSEEWLSNFFVSIMNLSYPLKKISINFVDNNSSDSTCDIIESFIKTSRKEFKDLHLYKRPNLGFGSGHHYGITHTIDEFVLVTNVDTELYSESLTQVVNTALFDDKDVACWEFRQTPYEHPKYYDPVTLLTNWSAHACVLLRRSAYLDVGGYDQKIFMYGEDVELSYRFRAKGWKLRYVPNAVVKHYVNLEDNSLRPNQLSGSTSSNLLMRYRYGSLRDIIAGEAFFSAVKSNEGDKNRIETWKKVRKIVSSKRLHYLSTRIWNSKAYFPFREFDYDDTRQGQNVVSKPFSIKEMKKLPLVSIVTRTHGPSDKFLSNCISSVLNQTYPCIEHIIVEDRTDDGKDLVESINKIYGDRVRYFKSPGRGRSECGNFGAKQAKGDYICWLDNDDLLFADHIETLMRGFEKNLSAVCSYSLAWEAIGDNVEGETRIKCFNLIDSHNRPYKKERLLIENFIPIQSIIFRKSLFDKLGGFNSDLTYLEDWNLWARYAEMGDFVFTPRVTSLYITPHDSKTRRTRQGELHAAYESVRQITIKDTSSIRENIFIESTE
jgi:GT2 family glycosyltransferase